MEATERGGALVVTIVLGPKIDTDGTMKSNTTTDFEASLRVPGPSPTASGAGQIHYQIVAGTYNTNTATAKIS